MIRLRRGFHLCQGYDVTIRRDRRWRKNCGLSSPLGGVRYPGIFESRPDQWKVGIKK